MAQNITLLGAGYTDVPAVVLPKTGGGTAEFYDMSGNLDFLGRDAALVSHLYDGAVALEDTNFPTWTPSTTASTIKTYTNVGTFTADMVSYDYYIRWKWDFQAAYPAGTVLLAAPLRLVGCYWHNLFRRPNTFARMESGTCVYAAAQNSHTTGSAWIKYVSASGAETLAQSASYGIYSTLQAPGISNATANTPTITVRTPTIAARCSNTYFSTDMAAAIDQADSKMIWSADLIRVRVGTSQMRSYYIHTLDLWNNPLTAPAEPEE